jgi:hypothetical protein
MPTAEFPEYPLDKIHRWRDWCAMVGIHPVTAWRLVKEGRGPIVTQLSTRIKGVRHKHHLTWLAAREPHQDDAAA